MNDELSEQQIEAILKALDEALEAGPWEDSNFLRVIGKKLRGIREKVSAQLNATQADKAKKTPQWFGGATMRNDQQEIYISLYSTEGSVIQSWERILANLQKQIISRPIYADEEDVKALIRTKENKNNEAYVSLFINQSDILPLASDKIPIDKLGKRLLTLKDRALNPNNINRFIHKSGTYHYHRGRLIKDIPEE